jgi:hypothetical protein
VKFAAVSSIAQTVCFNCGQGLDASDPFRVLTRTCGACFASLGSSGDVEISEYLEVLEHPAALLAKDHTIIVANNHFRTLRLHEEAIGVKVGEALECMYSATLGRCGETVACILCALRRSVEQTWLTGQGMRGVPMSYPHRATERKRVEVNTEKVGDAVLVIVSNPPDP